MAVRDFPPIDAEVFRPVRRVAMLVVHSNPLAEPGSGDAGGMTVYVRQMAYSLALRGIEVDIFTRRNSATSPAEVTLRPGVRVIQVQAGAPDLSKEQIPAFLPEFSANLLQLVESSGISYDVVHSHYWLSGKVAAIVSARWKVPFVHTFHTLGREKNRARRPGDLMEPEFRLDGEARVIADACAIVASTAEERKALIELYSAHPERIHLIPPGVDHSTFRPDDRETAKEALGLAGKKVMLFVGRLQPLKAADIAVEALGHLVDWGRLGLDDVRLLIVGGSSGQSGAGEMGRLAKLVEDLGLTEAVQFIPAQPHHGLPAFYQAADVCLVPSYTESFGLVALEAQASGVPVVGSAVGGLKAIVRHGQTGFLVSPGASEAFAERAWMVLSDPRLSESMGRLAVCSSGDFAWDRSAGELHDLYTAGSRSNDCSPSSMWSGKKPFGSRTIVLKRS
ncbi:MAG TPA: glycosyltransferase [Actinomycetota bacterium]|nr:glycosyltransferase [Actinomycetota bacterium]